MRRSALLALAALGTSLALACGGGPTLATHGGIGLALQPATPEVADVLAERLARSGERGEVRVDGELVHVEIVAPTAGADELALWFTTPGRFELYAVDEANSAREDIELVHPAVITGQHVVSVVRDVDPFTGQPRLNLGLSTHGGMLFAALTERVVGERIAIVIDGEVLSAPVVHERIAGGHVQISGLDEAQARAVELALQAGELPEEIELVSVRHIGPAE